MPKLAESFWLIPNLSLAIAPKIPPGSTPHRLI